MPAYIDDINTLNFTHKRGTTFQFSFNWMGMGTNVDPNNIIIGSCAPIALAGYTAKMQVRYRPGGPILHEANIGNGGIIINTTVNPNLVLVSIPAEVSLQWPDQTQYVYDVLLMQPDGVTYRALEGLFNVDANVTQTVA